MPLEEDFSIESILQAIEPDIRATLDSIAEIYGKSKLSLANQHGSHMQPFGEIQRAPATAAGGLVTVEEASSDNERLAAGSEESASSENALQEERSAMISYPRFSDQNLSRTVSSREFVATPRPSGRAFFLGATEAAPAVVSEVHLDAQADQQQQPLPRTDDASTQQAGTREDHVAFALAVLDWFRGTSQPRDSPNAYEGLELVENRLRTMLERQSGGSSVDSSV